jgi:ubiquinone/menaquinone biosynthesis C-methylase UbiE
MVNLKNYSVHDDFSHHKEEFFKTYEIICPYTTLNDKMVLNLCSGTGLHTGFLVRNGARVIGTDILDYETLWGGNFKGKLLEIFRDNNEPFDGSKCQFIRMNAENLLFRDDLFDFVYCINAFEHIQDPSNALLEIWRVLKPGGYAFIQFDPLYYCDTGSHMFDFFPEPWGHLVYSEDEYIQKIRSAHCPEEMIQDFRSGLNKKRRRYFIKLFSIFTDDKLQIFEKKASYEWSGVSNPEFMKHNNFERLQKIYLKEDLLFRGMNILLKKI